MGKVKTALDHVSKDGKYNRVRSQFRDWVLQNPKFPAESGRYHLYVSLACPWATRTMAFRALKGLEDAISVHTVHPTWKRTRPDDPSDLHKGWIFAEEGQDTFFDDDGRAFGTQACTPDSLNGCRSVRDLYDLAVGGEYTASSFTTPILWDSKERTIVNNESSEICRMLNSSFNAVAKNPGLDLYPDSLKEKTAELEEWIYHDINNGVYKSGFAKSQGAYDEAVEKLYAALDRVEALLSESRYLCGDTVTGIDIWLFMTLIRFDPVYVVYFKCSKKCIREYPNMFNYVKDLFQVPEIASSVDFFHIRTHYFTSHSQLNPFAIVPAMPTALDYSKPHNRDRSYPIKE